MALSAYDRWKTTPPPCPPESGDCLECGTATEWISGRQLVARQVRQLPKSARIQLLAALKKTIQRGQCFCAGCQRDAIHVRLSPCICGARTAWGCICP